MSTQKEVSRCCGWGLGMCLAASVLTACGGSSATLTRIPLKGCEQIVHDVPAQVMPETSGMSCVEIKEMIEVGPPEPGVYFLESPVSHLSWKCHLYDVNTSTLLLRCTHSRHQFSLVRQTKRHGITGRAGTTSASR